MSLRAGEIGALVPALAAELCGRHLQRAHQIDPHTLVLGLGGRWLLLSIHPRASRLHLVPAKPATPATPTAFAMLLRKDLGGARLAEMAQRDSDRVVTLTFSTGARLVAELFGRGGNLVLVGADGLCRGALVGPAGAPYRARAAPAPREEPLRFATSEEVRAHYQAVLAAEAGARGERERTARRRRLERLIANLEADAGRASEAPRLRRQADLLLAHLHEVPRGARQVSLPDDFATGEPITIELDPARSAKEQAQALYRRARKLEGGRAIIERRLGEARERLGELAATPTPAPETAAPRAAPRGRGAAAATRALPYRAFVSAAGDPIWVGKGARENDALTFRSARGNDLWLHVRDGAGAHVIARVDPGRPADERTIHDAAALAAHFSSLREEPQADVQVALRKHVRKARAPGAVYVSQARTVRVRRDPDRLARLLQSRDPDPRNS